MQAFFTDADLKGWWQVTRAFTVARPLGMYAIEWESTDFKDDVLGRLGGAFHGTVIDYRANASFFLAEVYWQPPDGDPIGPMALEVQCRPARQRPPDDADRQAERRRRRPALRAVLRDHEPRLGRRAAAR